MRLSGRSATPPISRRLQASSACRPDGLRLLRHGALARLHTAQDSLGHVRERIRRQPVGRSQRPGRNGRGRRDLPKVRRTVLHLSLVRIQLSGACHHVWRGLPRYQVRLRRGLAVRHHAALRRAVRTRFHLLRHGPYARPLTGPEGAAAAGRARGPASDPYSHRKRVLAQDARHIRLCGQQVR